MSYVVAYQPVSSDNVTTSGTSAQSEVAPALTRTARVWAKGAAMWVKVGGVDPTATTSDMYFAQDHVEYFRIRPDEKIAAIQDTEAGTMNVTWMRGLE